MDDVILLVGSIYWITPSVNVFINKSMRFSALSMDEWHHPRMEIIYRWCATLLISEAPELAGKGTLKEVALIIPAWLVV